jgi:hypothetical protein
MNKADFAARTVRPAVPSPDVEIILLNWNGKEDTIRCLESLRRTRYGNFTVTMVDQNSGDGTAALVAEQYPEVNLVQNKVNNGFCKGNNQILRGSTAKYCVLLNNDTEQDPYWLDHLVREAESDPDVAALQPKVLSMGDRRRFDHAGAAGGFIDVYGYPVCRGRIFDHIEEDHGQYDDARDVFWCCGVAMFLRMEVLRRIGYLDEVMFSYAEETDLCWRMNLAGYRLRYVPRSVIFHKGSGTWGARRHYFRKEYLIHRNHWIILFKNYSLRTWCRIFPTKILLELMAFARFLFGNPVKSLAILKANLWILSHLRWLLHQRREIESLRKRSDREVQGKMINSSTAWHYFVLRRRWRFSDYVKWGRDY